EGMNTQIADGIGKLSVLPLFVAEIGQSAADIFGFDDFRDALGVGLLHWVGSAVAVESLLDWLGVDESVSVVQRVVHGAADACEFLRRSCGCELRTEFLVDDSPVDMLELEEGIVLGESLPEDGVIVFGSIGKGLVANIGTR